MAVYLKCVLLGEPHTGKSSLLRHLSAGHKHLTSYEAATTDPSSQMQLIFRIEELGPDLPNALPGVACAMVVYDSTQSETYEVAQTRLVPYVLSKLSPEASFVMLIGTHSDLKSMRTVDSQDAEEFAAGNSLFHMEVSNTLKKNIDLTLKVMRIRATYLIKKHPEIRSQKTIEKQERPLEIDFTGLTEEETGTKISATPTPQFSEKHHERKHSFEVQEDLLNQCGSFSFPLKDIPLPETDFNAMQLRKKTRYEEALGEHSTSETGGNMSFANMSEISDHEEEDQGPEQSPPKAKEFTLQGEGLLDSQARSLKLPKVPLLPIVAPSGSQTERRPTSPYSSNSTSGNSTERRSERTPLLTLNVTLGQDVTTHAHIYEGDSAMDIAKRCLGDLEDSEVVLSDLSQKIEVVVQDYCAQLTHIKRQPLVPLIRHIVSERKISPVPEMKRSESARYKSIAETPRKLLFKVKVNMGEKKGEVVVKQGDDLAGLAKQFAERNLLNPNMQIQVLELLKHAKSRYDERLES